jgi:3-deoxy-manno-octulosonate cytidylyltransferase (CMP-KDO synthetase)
VIVAILPARLQSERLPRKVLADIGGVPMFARTHARVVAAGFDRVIVATDAAEVAAVARARGIDVTMTPPARNGTERVAAAAAAMTLSPGTTVVNVQADEPLVDPGLLRAIAGAVTPRTPIATAAAPLAAEEAADPARVKVIVDAQARARQFSRQPIPRGGPYWVHVGVYAFEVGILAAVVALPPTEIEAGEKLEQLRWMQAGYAIAVVRAGHAGPSVDTPSDLERVRAIVAGLQHPPVTR